MLRYMAVNSGILATALTVNGYFLVGISLALALGALDLSSTTIAAITGGTPDGNHVPVPLFFVDC